MGQPVVHFEVIGKDPERLRNYYAGVFGWEFDVGGSVAPSVSAAGEYGFMDHEENNGGVGIPGGIGGGAEYDTHTVFYVGVPDVEAALRKAESGGGIRRMGPEKNPGGQLVVGHFTDPEGNLIGVAGPA